MYLKWKKAQMIINLQYAKLKTLSLFWCWIIAYSIFKEHSPSFELAIISNQCNTKIIGDGCKALLVLIRDIALIERKQSIGMGVRVILGIVFAGLFS